MQIAPHPWLLVAPWYRWTEPGTTPTPEIGRLTAPVIEKYGSATFIEELLAEPQRTLRYQDADVVHEAIPAVSRPRYALSALTLQRTSLRKLFLPTHSRFYLVVVELHCDVVGFPSVAREQVCQAGFVVRRHSARIAPEVSDAVAAAFRDIARAQVRGGRVIRRMLSRAAAGTPAGALGTVQARRREQHLERVKTVVDARSARIDEWIEQGLVGEQLQWWVAHPAAPGIGAWQPVADAEETPQQIVEAIYPLYPLIPDATLPTHTARGRSIWFGVVPTGGEDLDADGNPRYDDRATYEIRCFVRRHKPECPRTNAVPDCHGEVVWSLASELYRLAAQFDLTGTSNRPVTVQLPDLRQLEAQANTQPFGSGMGLRLVAPPESSLEFSVDGDGRPTNGSLGGPSICSFAIPLITIVATFVLSLFMPIVVFVFQLWFLLLLRFCIPPSFSLDGAVSAALEADMTADVDISVSASVIIGAFAAGSPGVGNAMATAHAAGDLSINALGGLASTMNTDFRADAPPDIAAGLPAPADGVRTGNAPSLSDGLQYRTDFHPVPA